jgi:hypothetical protein
LEARGRTNLSKAWYLGLLELQSYATERHLNRLILLSDGQANEGEQKSSVLGGESSRARDEAGITTSTIGIGTDFNEEILDTLARHSGGRFWFIGEARIADIINEEFSGALSVLLGRPGISIQLPAGTSIRQELNSLPKLSDRYRLRPIKGNDSIGLAVRLSVDPKLVEANELVIGATLYDGVGVVKRTESTLPLVALEQFTQSPEDTRVAAIVNSYRATVSNEQMLQLDQDDTSTMVKMLQSGSELMRQVEIKLAGTAAKSWDEEQAQQAREAEMRLAELRMEMAENDALASVMQLIQLMQGLGEGDRALKLFTSSQKMGRQKGNRKWNDQRRSHHDDWASSELLSIAMREAEVLISRFPQVDELQIIREKLNEQLARFSR